MSEVYSTVYAAQKVVDVLKSYQDNYSRGGMCLGIALEGLLLVSLTWAIWIHRAVMANHMCLAICLNRWHKLLPVQWVALEFTVLLWKEEISDKSHLDIFLVDSPCASCCDKCAYPTWLPCEKPLITTQLAKLCSRNGSLLQNLNLPIPVVTSCNQEYPITVTSGSACFSPHNISTQGTSRKWHLYILHKQPWITFLSHLVYYALEESQHVVKILHVLWNLKCNTNNSIAKAVIIFFSVSA